MQALTSLGFTTMLFAAATLLPARANAQTGGQPIRVQLPTFHVFGVSTTVLVPDRGSAYLGGVNSARRGGQQFGPGNRAYGRTTSAGGVSASATIIDLGEMDRALLAEAARRRGATHDVLGRRVHSLNNGALKNGAAKPPAARQKQASARPSWRALWRSSK